MKTKFLCFLISLFCILSMVQIKAADMPADGTIYTAFPAKSIPVIDGNGNDACWNDASWAPINQLWYGTAATSADDYSGKYKILWTPQRLYILMEIVDDTLCLQPNTDVTQIYNYECAEIFIDEDNSRETNYSGTYKAIAYHINSTGGVYYYIGGTTNWTGSLADNLNYKMTRVGKHTFDWEFELKVFDKNFVYGGNNTPVTLTDGKVMGLSLAYNDNDGGTTRQSMYGSAVINATDKNISYYNASVFGTLTLSSSTTGVNQPKQSSLSQSSMYYANNKLNVTFPKSNEDVTVQLFDMFGKELAAKTFKSDSDATTNIDVPNITSGVYLAKLSNSQQQISKKIVIKTN